VLGIVTIFDYGFPATQRKLSRMEVDLTALTNLDTVLHQAECMGIIKKEEASAIKAWQKHPSKYTI
jgi:orotate phosphoribosyltransferase